MLGLILHSGRPRAGGNYLRVGQEEGTCQEGGGPRKVGRFFVFVYFGLGGHTPYYSELYFLLCTRGSLWQGLGDTQGDAKY